LKRGLSKLWNKLLARTYLGKQAITANMERLHRKITGG
jgi:hypothetical protein